MLNILLKISLVFIRPDHYWITECRPYITKSINEQSDVNRHLYISSENIYIVSKHRVVRANDENAKCHNLKFA
jgi:hypothetical protein